MIDFKARVHILLDANDSYTRLYEDGRLEISVGGRWMFLRQITQNEYDSRWAGLETVPDTEFKL